MLFLKDAFWYYPIYAKVYQAVSFYQNYHTCHIPYPSYPPEYDNQNNVWQVVQIVKVYICKLLQPSVVSLVAREDI
jgi:hypothetical protein